MKLKSCIRLLCLPAALAAQQSGYVTVSDGARLFYRTSGHPGPGIDTIIAIHGGPGLDLGTIYNDLALMFGDRHVVIYYDQRGGGRSELPADTTRLVAARQIQDLDDLRKHFGLAARYARSALVRPASRRKLRHRTSGECEEDDLLRTRAAEEGRLLAAVRPQLQRAARQHTASSDAGGQSAAVGFHRVRLCGACAVPRVLENWNAAAPRRTRSHVAAHEGRLL